MTLTNALEIPTHIFDYWMSRLTGSQIKIILCIQRIICDCGHQKGMISNSQLIKMSGLSKRAVIKTCQELVRAGLIVSHANFGEFGGRTVNLYSINYNLNI